MTDDTLGEAATIAMALPDSVLLIDPSANVKWGNPAAERLFGMTMDDVAGRSGLEFIHPDDLQVAALAMTSVQGKDVGTLLELRLRTANGWRLVEVRGAPLGDDVLLVLRDITDRRRWEVAGDEVARFRSLTQNAASVTMLIDADSLIRASSGGLTRLLGHDQEHYEGQPLSTLVAQADTATLAEALAQVVAVGVGTPITVDVELRRGDGGTVPFALTLTNLLDDPTVEGVVVSGHDITDRVAAVAELRGANSVLAATLESTADGILVVDLDGRITSFNGRFAEMWRIPTELLLAGDNTRALASIVDQVVAPDAFAAKLTEIYADSEAMIHDVIEFTDGRIFERDSLPQRIDGFTVGRVWSFRDITDHRDLQNKLIHQAFHDPLTGLSNQALFRDRVAHASARLERVDRELAVLFIDLDDFKRVNDSMGHSAGDELLITVSERIAESIRAGDTAARLGGDEFAVLIEELQSHQDAIDVADRVISRLREPIALGTKQVSITASVGIAYGAAAVGSDEMLRNADLAMYTAKTGGKNCHRAYESAMHEAAVERLDLETHLGNAIGGGQLLVQYQPIYELQAGRRIVAMEALVRWNHPERGLLGPMAFIPFAEECGLIDEIGYHVLATACAEARSWVDLVGTLHAPAISVNLSPHQLADPNFPERVEALLRQIDFHPAQLILEITEGALMRDPASAVESLERLSRLGIRLAVDDFGTGYSSLAYLRQFPVDILKIDQSFVRDMLDYPTRSLAQAIVQISHTLGLMPIAEGVESEEQAAVLRSFGCDMAQGYLLARPMDASVARQAVCDGAPESARRARAAQVAPTG
jgi:diguanylate cyclase (GGDEF)-like protein/PAS domain S-box-containing protein